QGKCQPYIAIAGDCSQAAYILRPLKGSQSRQQGDEIGRQGGSSVGTGEGGWVDNTNQLLGPLAYEVVCSIDVQGTVGSLAVSYGPFLWRGEEGWAKLFVPNYDGDRIYMFAMDPGPA
ncbi:unnamed protein product, partial [Choristocarpus tenellus]